MNAPARSLETASHPATAAPGTRSHETERGAEEIDATRQRILDSAARVLSRDGFAGAKLSDIAAEAHLKVATLYYYYRRARRWSKP